MSFLMIQQVGFSLTITLLIPLVCLAQQSPYEGLPEYLRKEYEQQDLRQKAADEWGRKEAERFRQGLECRGLPEPYHSQCARNESPPAGFFKWYDYREHLQMKAQEAARQRQEAESDERMRRWQEAERAEVRRRQEIEQQRQRLDEQRRANELRERQRQQAERERIRQQATEIVRRKLEPPQPAQVQSGGRNYLGIVLLFVGAGGPIFLLGRYVYSLHERILELKKIAINSNNWTDTVWRNVQVQQNLANFPGTQDELLNEWLDHWQRNCAKNFRTEALFASLFLGQGFDPTRNLFLEDNRERIRRWSLLTGKGIPPCH